LIKSVRTLFWLDAQINLLTILVSSNLERLLYKFSGNNDELVAKWMNQLKTEGKYEVTDEVKVFYLLSFLHTGYIH